MTYQCFSLFIFEFLQNASLGEGVDTKYLKQIPVFDS